MRESLNCEGETKESQYETIVREIFSDAGHQENEVFTSLSENYVGINIRALIKASKVEKDNKMNDFDVEVSTYALPKKEVLPIKTEMPDIDIFVCDDASFIIDGKKIEFKKISPKGIGLNIFLKNKMGTDRKEGGFYDPEKRSVFLSNFYSPGAFIGMLHEIGHAIEFSKKSESQIEVLSMLPPQAMIRRDSIEERNAWAHALRIAKKYDLPILEHIKKEAERCLESYQKRAEKFGVDIQVTNRRRRENRSKK